ncbi:MAG: nitrogen regulation protein NR(II) [Nitrospiria bacterium]
MFKRIDSSSPASYNSPIFQEEEMKQSSADSDNNSRQKPETSKRELCIQIHKLQDALAEKTVRLRAYEVGFSSIFEDTSIPLFTFNKQGKILLWNRAFSDLLKISDEDMKAHNILKKIIKENPPERIKKMLETIFEGQGFADIAGLISTEPGNEHHLSISALPVRGPEGAVIFGISIVTDITEKKHLEQALLQTEKMAAMGTLASGLAHEVGTPMNVILGRAESLLRHTKEEKTAKGLMIIMEQIDRITRLIQHLLTFARGEPIEKKQLDLNGVINKGVDFIGQHAKAKGISINTDLDPHLPEVHADGDQVLQVMINLLLNAIDAIEGEGSIRVTTHLMEVEQRAHPRYGKSSRGNQMIQILLKDTGIGIDPAHLDKIFDPFFTTKPVGKGTGLGLAVALGTVRNHGGQIMVASAVGQGTTFSIRLPVK